MKGLRFKILDLGDMTFYKRELIKTDNADEIVVSPALAILIQHPVIGNILLDTGNDDRWQITYPAAIRKTYPVTHLVTIQSALEKESLTPADINRLILSHLHFDHVGGLKFFSGTNAGRKVILSEAEKLDAFERVRRAPVGIDGAYIADLFEGIPGIGYETIKADTVLAEGITLFLQRCHTAGVIGLRLDLENAGTVIFCGDTIYTREAYEQALPPGGAINMTDDEFHDNLKLIKAMQTQFEAQVFFGHDIEQATEWMKKGWID